LIPGSDYRVHDKARPRPRVVTPGVANHQPPSDAIVLFGGTDLAGWLAQKGGGAAGWNVTDGYMEVVPGTGGIESKAHFGDCQLHLEWAAPAAVKGDSQGRGNSGVFLMGRYEIQVLDCYANPTYADGTTGAIYGEYPPLVNACRRPGEWQSYDIVWKGPRFDGDTLTRPASVTVFLNGVLLHLDQKLIGPTGHRAVYPYVPHAEAGPLALQDHGDLVRFRNIWYRPLTAYDEGGE
jgi:hypothetical protein